MLIAFWFTHFHLRYKILSPTNRPDYLNTVRAADIAEEELGSLTALLTESYISLKQLKNITNESTMEILKLKIFPVYIFINI